MEGERMSGLEEQKSISTKRKVLGNVTLLILLLLAGYVLWGYKYFEQTVGSSPHAALLNTSKEKNIRTRDEKLKANRKSVELGLPSTPWEHRLIDYMRDDLVHHDIQRTLFGINKYVENIMSAEEREHFENKKKQLIEYSIENGEPITAQEVWLLEDLESELRQNNLPLNMFGVRALQAQEDILNTEKKSEEYRGNVFDKGLAQKCKQLSEESEYEYKPVYAEVIYLNHYPEHPCPPPEKCEEGQAAAILLMRALPPFSDQGEILSVYTKLEPEANFWERRDLFKKKSKFCARLIEASEFLNAEVSEPEIPRYKIDDFETIQGIE